jgi:Maltose operon periplasmic protein precursor (MalM)
MLAFRPMSPALLVSTNSAWLPRALLGLAALAVAAGAGASAPAVATDPAQFRYESLPADGAIDFAIDAKSPTFEFQTGVSAFRAFRLPAGGPFYVDVRSFLDGPPDPARARVFYPVIAVLTDDFLVSRSTELELLRFDLPMQEGTLAPAYHVSLGIDPEHTRERYLVVFTPAQLVAGRRLPPISSAETAAEAAHVAYLGAAPHGRLRISVRRGEPAPPAAADVH